jgi:hypothetical protein
MVLAWVCPVDERECYPALFSDQDPREAQRQRQKHDRSEQHTLKCCIFAIWLWFSDTSEGKTDRSGEGTEWLKPSMVDTGLMWLYFQTLPTISIYIYLDVA